MTALGKNITNYLVITRYLPGKMEGKVIGHLLPAPPEGNRFYPVTGKNG